MRIIRPIDPRLYLPRALIHPLPHPQYHSQANGSKAIGSWPSLLGEKGASIQNTRSQLSGLVGRSSLPKMPRRFFHPISRFVNILCCMVSRAQLHIGLVCKYAEGAPICARQQLFNEGVLGPFRQVIPESRVPSDCLLYLVPSD
jgi:hypothetical protein